MLKRILFTDEGTVYSSGIKSPDISSVAREKWMNFWLRCDGFCCTHHPVDPSKHFCHAYYYGASASKTVKLNSLLTGAHGALMWDQESWGLW